MILRCPVCKAENSTPPNCRRCKADLSMVFALEGERANAIRGAQEALRAGQWREVKAFAERADELRRDAESGQLLALAALLLGVYEEAWRRYHRCEAAT